jgi:hypothetical protein
VIERLGLAEFLLGGNGSTRYSLSGSGWRAKAEVFEGGCMD